MSDKPSQREIEESMKKRRLISERYCQPHGCNECEIGRISSCLGYFEDKKIGYKGPVFGLPIFENAEIAYNRVLKLTSG